MAQQESRNGYSYPTPRNSFNIDGNSGDAHNDNDKNFNDKNNGNNFNQNISDLNNFNNIGSTFNNQNDGNSFDHFNQNNGNNFSQNKELNSNNDSANKFNHKNGNNLSNFKQKGRNNLSNFNNNNNINSQLGLQNGQQPVSINNDPDKSSFSYGVKQPMYGNFYGHKANHNGRREEGQYYVLLPNRQLMTVQYVADATGYRPTISFTSIAGDAMFDNFLFEPESKGSQKSTTQGELDTLHFRNVSTSNNLQSTTTRPQTTACRQSLSFGCTVSTMPLRSTVTIMSPMATTTNRVPTTSRSSTTPIQQIPNITHPTSTTIRQIFTTLCPKSTTTQPKLTTTRPLSATIWPVSTTTQPRLTTTSPRPSVGYFIGVVSTLKPVTMNTPTTPLSSRSAMPRGRTPFFFPKLIQSTGIYGNGRGQTNIAPYETLSPPLQSYQSRATNNRNNNNETNVNGSSIADNVNIGSKIDNGNSGYKVNFLTDKSNMINASTGKPKSSTSNGNNISFNAVSNGYLPPKVNPNPSPGRQRSENDLFNEGFNFFEFNRLTTTAATPTRITALTRQTPTGFNLPINRLASTTSTPIIRSTQQTTRSSMLPNTFPTTRTTSLTTAISQTQSTKKSRAFSTTQSPVRTTTMHKYNKSEGHAYTSVPSLKALVADGPVPSGRSRISGAKSLHRGSTVQTAAPSTTVQPITTQSLSLPPKVKQLSPFFEFFKIKS